MENKMKILYKICVPVLSPISGDVSRVLSK